MLMIEEVSYNPRYEKLKLFFTNPQAVIGLALVARILSPAPYLRPSLQPTIPFRWTSPLACRVRPQEHWAGTDQLGRDTYSRVLYGGRVALKIAAIGVSVALFIGSHARNDRGLRAALAG